MLKHGVLLLINNQEELNLLADVVDGVEVDALHVDEPYLVFMDDVLHVVPQSQLEQSHQFYGVKPRKLKSWYRNIMQKRKTNETKTENI